MNYLQPKRLEALANHYVLGTLSRRARRRFNQLIDEHRAIEDAVLQVEEDLSSLAWSLQPIQPSQLLWRRIANRLTPRVSEQPVARSKTWPVAAGVFLTALLGVSSLLWIERQRPPEQVVQTVIERPNVGVIANERGQPLWFVQLIENERADVSVQTLPEPQAANDYQLWLLRDDGVPISVGLLPQTGKTTLTLSQSAREALASSQTLAVSLEPIGGSPEPVPTGPVLFTAPIVGS